MATRKLEGRPVYWNPRTGEQKEVKTDRTLDRLINQGWEWLYDLEPIAGVNE